MAFPSEAQHRVITQSQRPVVVVAAPGTGKTRTIVERMIRLVKSDSAATVSFVTFTRASRRDTESKLREEVGRATADLAPNDLPRISTLHTFAKRLVHRFASAVGRDSDFSVLVGAQGEKAMVVSEVIDDLALDVERRALENGISCFRSTAKWPPEIDLSAEQLAEVIDAFDILLRLYDTFDMEGIMVAACRIMTSGHGNIGAINLQVDEYQDLNPCDQELVRLVTREESSQIVVVGDDAQSIYGMRYANWRGIRDLWDSEDWDNVRFEECHRLPPHVLRAAHALIEDGGYLGAEVKVPADTGKRIVTLQCTTEKLQLKAIAAYVTATRESGTTSDGKPLAYEDFMVLCPTRAQADRAAKELKETHKTPTIGPQPSVVPQGTWRLLLILRMLGGDSLALRQWLGVAGVEEHRIKEIRRAAMHANQSLFRYCEEVPDEIISSIFEALNEVRENLVDPEKLTEGLGNFPSLRPDSDVHEAVEEIVVYTPAVPRMIGRIYEKYGILDRDEEGYDTAADDAVLVTTMHSAKGLEAEFVLVPWLNRKFMPAAGRDPREEERVLYVALTRAKQDVVLMFHEEWDSQRGRRLKSEAMSPFLHSIRMHLDIRRASAKDFADK